MNGTFLYHSEHLLSTSSETISTCSLTLARIGLRAHLQTTIVSYQCFTAYPSKWKTMIWKYMSMIYWSKIELSSITLLTLKSHLQHYGDFEWSSVPVSAHLVSPPANSSASLSQWGIEVNFKKIQAFKEMKPSRMIKEMQRLIGRIIALNRFLSRSVERSLPFFKALK